MPVRALSVSCPGRMPSLTWCWKFQERKYELAKKFKIIIVNHQWIEDCIKQRKRVPEHPYTFQGRFIQLVEVQSMIGSFRSGATGFLIFFPQNENLAMLCLHGHISKEKLLREQGLALGLVCFQLSSFVEDQDPISPNLHDFVVLALFFFLFRSFPL